MYDPLHAIRRLYAESPEGADAPLAPAEAEELADLGALKAALEELPSIAPDAALVDAVVAGSMNVTVRLLYGEEIAGELPPCMAAEASALASVKRALDALPASAPDQHAIDAVVADAMHAPIRSLYGEAVFGELLPRHAAEAAAIGAVKRSLEALPPIAPDEEYVDAVVADAAHAPVRHLYGESAIALSAPLAAEARALEPVRAALEALPHSSPDAAVIDAVVAAAIGATAERRAPRAPLAPAANRPARAPSRRGRQIVGWVSSAMALLIVAGAFLWTQQQGTAPDQIAEADVAQIAPVPEVGEDGQEAAEPASPEAPSADPAGAAPPLVAEARPPSPPPAADTGASAAARPAPAPAAQVVEQPVAARQAPAPPAGGVLRSALASDAELAAALVSLDGATEANPETLRLLYLRLEAMRDAGMGWGEPATVLGADAPRPTSSANRGWMQVRVDR